MSARSEYGTEEVVRYLLSDLHCVYDRRKVVLLVFLAQYEVDGRLVYEFACGGRPLARAGFYIDCGVASDEVYDALRSEGFERPPREVCNYATCYRADPSLPQPELCYTGPVPQLPKPVETRLRDVLERFGSWSYQGLMRHVEWLLRLNPWKEYEYNGADVRRYMLDQGFRVVRAEKCRRDQPTRFTDPRPLGRGGGQNTGRYFS